MSPLDMTCVCERLCVCDESLQCLCIKLRASLLSIEYYRVDSKPWSTESRIKWRSASVGLCSTAAISSPADFIFTNVSHCGTYEACSKWQGKKNKMCFRYASLFRLVCQLVFVGGRTALVSAHCNIHRLLSFYHNYFSIKTQLTHPYV